MLSESIYYAVINHIKRFSPCVWYVGITNDVARRMKEHNVDQNHMGFAYVEATNSDHARKAESALLKDGFSGGPGGGENDAKWLYVYPITSFTKQ